MLRTVISGEKITIQPADVKNKKDWKRWVTRKIRTAPNGKNYIFWRKAAYYVKPFYYKGRLMWYEAISTVSREQNENDEWVWEFEL